MKKALITLALVIMTVSAMAQQPITRFRSPDGSSSYWQGDRWVGHTTVNPHTGTETYWPQQNYGYGYNSGCCYNRPFAGGYQMGRDIRTIFQGLTGGNRQR